MAVAFVSDDAAPVLLHFRDALRPDAAATVRQLRDLGLDCSIVSGDRAAAVAPIARALGLTAQTGMRPQDKFDAIARLAAGGRKVLMVGDGLNDGPALAAGHVSMAPAFGERRRPERRRRGLPRRQPRAGRHRDPASRAGRCAWSGRIS